MFTVGIDPGLHGAIARFDATTRGVEVFDMPIKAIYVGGRRRNEIDYKALWALFLDHCAATDQAILESVHAMPAQGVSSSFTFGVGYGALRLAIAARFAAPVILVQPAVWKRYYALPSDKDAARALASRVFPESAHLFAAKKHHGRAEAALIAHFGVSGLTLGVATKIKPWQKTGAALTGERQRGPS